MKTHSPHRLNIRTHSIGNSRSYFISLVALLGISLVWQTLALAQEDNAALRILNQDAIQRQQDDKPSINMSQNGALDLQALVQWAAKLQGFELILDNQQFQQTQNKVVFFSEVKVDKDTVMLLVQEVLRANGFALVDGQVDGWKRVASLPNIMPYTKVVPADGLDQKAYEYVTAIFELKNISSEAARNYLSTFFPALGGTQAQGVPNDPYKIVGKRLLIVTDMVRNIQKIRELLPQIDVPQEDVEISFYKVKNLEAKELEAQVNGVLNTRQLVDPTSSQDTVQPSPSTPFAEFAAANVKVTADVRNNRLILVGRNDGILAIRKLLEELDVPLGMELKSYQFQHIAAKKIDELMRQSLGGMTAESLERVYQSSVDAQSNQLVVSARSETHAKIESLKKQLDRPAQATPEQSPMKFYKLRNVKVTDIVATLQSIERTARPRNNSPRTPLNGIRGREGFNVNGPNNFQNSFQEGPPQNPPNFNNSLNNQFGQNSNDPRANSQFRSPNQQGFAGTNSFNSSSLNNLADLVSDLDTPKKLIPGEAQITVDENTNTLIVVAEPEVQALYAQLIEKLDVRRPQVLIEAHIVLIEGRDNLNLGVEISGGDREGDKKLFSFTSFGLSEVDKTNGALKITPGLGFNGTLVDPDTADVVIRALATHSRSRVISSPKVVVDDNGNGLLSSVAEQPFASVNATNTVATTSFAGFAQAGTTINVTPHISEDDYLNLEFDILVNTFTGAASANLPPPRNTDQIVSEVTIPDGFTVIVGGLNRERVARSINGLPFLERIPLIRNLTSSQTNDHSDGMLFIFLKPTVLRDDKFRDMIYLSNEEQQKAVIDGEYPRSLPKLIR